MHRIIEKTIAINATSFKAWKYLTEPDLMKIWMGDAEINVEVLTDWKPGNPITIKGFHHVAFENKGTVMQFDPLRIIQYSYLSSLSQLADTMENHSIISFLLKPDGERTLLTVTVENFPEGSAYQHFNFYWQGTIILLKNLIERND